MKRCSPRICVLLAPLTLMAWTCASADAVAAVQACMREQNDAARLSCYDREAPRLVEEQGPATGESQVQAPSADFGVRGSELARKQRSTISSDAVEPLSAVILALSVRPRGERVMTLSNGQVWAQKRSESYFPIEVGDEVTIERGALGSFRMKAPSGRSTKVTRIE